MTPPGQPDHPDFWLISQTLIDADGQSDGGEGVRLIFQRYVDVDSATYAASQRAMAALRAIGLPEEMLSVMAGMWLDGFSAGIRFQHLKTTGAHQLTDDDVPPATAT